MKVDGVVSCGWHCDMERARVEGLHACRLHMLWHVDASENELRRAYDSALERRSGFAVRWRGRLRVGRLVAGACNDDAISKMYDCRCSQTQ